MGAARKLYKSGLSDRPTPFDVEQNVVVLSPGDKVASTIKALIAAGKTVELLPGSYGIEETLAGVDTAKLVGAGYGRTTFAVEGGVTLGLTAAALSLRGIGDPPSAANPFLEGTDVTITAGGNDLAPTGLADAGALLIDPAAALTITGLLAPAASGRLLPVLNISATAGRTATIPDDSSSSAAANRIRTPNGQPFVLQPGGGCVLRYSGSRWHVVAALSPIMSFGRAASGAGGDTIIKPTLGAVDSTDLGGKIRMYVGVPVPNSASPSSEVQVRLEDETVIFCLKQIGGPASQLYFGNNGALRSGIITGSNLTLESGTTTALTAPTSISLSSPVVECSGQLSSAVHSITLAASMALDWNNGNHQRPSAAIAQNTTFTTSNLRSGALYTVEVTQDGTGGWTVTWPAAMKFAGTDGDVDTTANRVTMWTFRSDGSVARCIEKKVFTS